MRIVATSSLLFLGLVLVFLRSADGEPPPVTPKPGPNGNGQERKDQYGDPLPEGAVARLGTVRLRHPDSISELRFSPDGKTIASAGGDNSVRLWDVSSGKLVRQFVGHKGESVGSVAFSGDGRYLVSADYIGPARLWEVATGKELRQLGGEKAKIRRVAFSPDNKVVAGWSHQDQSIRLWDASTGGELHSLGNEASGDICLAFSPDSKTLATPWDQGPRPGRGEGGVRLWDVATGKELLKITSDPKGRASPIEFSPDGKTLAGVSADQTVRLWAVDSGQEVRRFEGHVGLVSGLAFADARTLVTTGQDDGTIRVWDAATGEERSQLKKPRYLTNPLVVAPDGKTLALAGYSGIISLRDLKSGEDRLVLDPERGCIGSAVFLPDGKTLVVESLDQTPRLWEAASGKVIRAFEGRLKTPVGGLFLTPDGKTLLQADNDGTISIRDVTTGKQVRTIGFPRGLSDFYLSPDGKTIPTRAGSVKEPLVCLRDLETGTEVRQYRGVKTHGLGAYAFSPDGRLLAHGFLDTIDYSSGRQSHCVLVWDVEAGEEVCRFTGHLGSIWSLAFSPDGRVLAAVGDGDEGIHLWEIATKARRGLLGKHSRGTIRFTFSHNGKLLASGGIDQRVRLWDTMSGEEIWQSPGYQGRIYSVIFSPDDRYLVSVGGNTAAMIWDVPSLVMREIRNPNPLSKEELEACWIELGHAEASTAFRSMKRLIARADQSIPLLNDRLQAVTLGAEEAAQITRWVTDLDDKEFFVRARASEELMKLGEKAVPALLNALEMTKSAEVRSRVDSLLKKLPDPATKPEWRRYLRAVEILEHLGTDDARELLDRVSKGISGARETREAELALKRLEKRRNR